MSATSLNERHWYITERWQYFSAERRVNLLRLIAIAAFYIIHLLHYAAASGKLATPGFLQLSDGTTVSAEAHLNITLLAIAWTMICVATLLCLRQRILPWWLKFLSTGCDLFFLTAILYIASGPASPLVVGYFLIIAMATPRMNLPLVRVATIGSVACYAVLLGCAKWPDVFWRADMNVDIPRYQQLIFALALTLTGIIMGQVVRGVRAMVDRYQQLESSDEVPA